MQKEAEDIAQVAQEKVTGIANGAKEVVNNVVNGTSEKINGELKPQVEEFVKHSSEALGIENLSPGSTSPRVIGSSFVPPVSVPHVPSTNGERKSSFSKPPSSKFAPSLPKDLPEPAGNPLPSNRKRSAPNDFTPTGKGEGGPSSPSKLGLKLEEDEAKQAPVSPRGVKFEDGVVPGEGKDGETILVPKPNKNVVERTVMTFIMIAGFIRKFVGARGTAWLMDSASVCRSSIYDCSRTSLSKSGLQGGYSAL